MDSIFDNLKIPLFNIYNVVDNLVELRILDKAIYG